MRIRTRLTAAFLSVLLAATPLAAQQPTAIPVGTLAAELRPITKASEFVGRVEAIERVEIRARVTGFLQEVLFKEGDVVKEGDVLYRIERDTFEAAVQQAQGALLEAQGKFANATAQRARTAGTGEDRRRLACAARRARRRTRRAPRARWSSRMPT